MGTYDSIGVAYVAFGARAVAEAAQSIASLRQSHDWPIVTVSDETIAGCQRVPCERPGWGARRAKVNLTNLVPPSWDAFLYLDADTRVRGDLSAGFEILADGWDMAITYSENQERDWLWHIPDEERRTMEEHGLRLMGPVLQGGMWFVARNERTDALFAAWAAEWEHYQREDQGALLRALRQAPVRVWLLGRAWNGGELVEHLFGRARQ